MAGPSARYDVAIVGGGPAGSTAGTLLAQAGLRVACFERERFPRFHVGESLLPANVPLFERLKFAAITASNLDEFFMIRVAGLKRAVEAEDQPPDISGLTAAQQLPLVCQRSRFVLRNLYKLTTTELLRRWRSTVCASLHGRISPLITSRASARGSARR